MDTVLNCCEKPWFHGHIDATTAEKRLRNQPIGSFLVRFSSSIPGCFSISYRFGEVGDTARVLHLQIQRQPLGKFVIRNFTFNSLPGAIEELQNNAVFKEYCLTGPCDHPSDFASIFENSIKPKKPEYVDSNPSINEEEIELLD